MGCTGGIRNNLQYGECVTGFFFDHSNLGVLLDEEDILYQQFNIEGNGPCDELSSEGIPESWICPGCDIDETTVQYDINYPITGYDCEVTAICGGEEQIIEGEIFFEYFSDQNDAYNCEEFCEGGNYCVSRMYCDLEGDYGSVLIEETVETIVISDADNNAGCEQYPNGCKVFYYCLGDDDSFHEFCRQDCDSGLYPCIIEDLSEGCLMPGATQLAAIPDGSVESEEGHTLQKYNFEIVETNNFIVSDIFPNPFQTELTIKLTASYNGKARIRLVNLLGQTSVDIKEEFSVGYNPIFLNLNNAALENGLYHIFIEDELGNTHIDKVVFSR